MRWTRRLLVAAGLALMGYAVVGGLDSGQLQPGPQLVFLGTLLVGHDLLFVPAVLAVGVVIGRFAPARQRTVVRIAGMASLAVVVVALPFVLGRGRRPDEPSALPLDYGRGLAVVLAAVWLAAGAALVVAWWRRRPGRGSAPEPREPA